MGGGSRSTSPLPAAAAAAAAASDVYRLVPLAAITRTRRRRRDSAATSSPIWSENGRRQCSNCLSERAMPSCESSADTPGHSTELPGRTSVRTRHCRSQQGNCHCQLQIRAALLELPKVTPLSDKSPCPADPSRAWSSGPVPSPELPSDRWLVPVSLNARLPLTESCQSSPGRRNREQPSPRL